MQCKCIIICNDLLNSGYLSPQTWNVEHWPGREFGGAMATANRLLPRGEQASMLTMTYDHKTTY